MKGHAYPKFLRAAEKMSRTLSEKVGDNLVAVYIYGSVARGDCVESSDVDLHIVLRDYAQAEDIPHTNWVGDVPVEVSPHRLSFYKTTPEWILENIEEAVGWEGLWEMGDIIVLYDPGDLISPFKGRITPVLNDKSLLRARANISFKAAKTEMEAVKRDISEGALDRALVHMYALGGCGVAYSGVAVQALKTVIKFAGLPLTTRRIWLRFVEACQKLNAPGLQSSLEGCYGMDRLDQKNLQEVFGEALCLANGAKPPFAEEMIHEVERSKLTFAEFTGSGEIGVALVYVLGGFSAVYNELGSEGGQVRLKLEELLYKIAGLYSQRELEDRVRIALETMNSINGELISS